MAVHIIPLNPYLIPVTGPTQATPTVSGRLLPVVLVQESMYISQHSALRDLTTLSASTTVHQPQAATGLLST